ERRRHRQRRAQPHHRSRNLRRQRLSLHLPRRRPDHLHAHRLHRLFAGGGRADSRAHPRRHRALADLSAHAHPSSHRGAEQRRDPRDLALLRRHGDSDSRRPAGRAAQQRRSGRGARLRPAGLADQAAVAELLREFAGKAQVGGTLGADFMLRELRIKNFAVIDEVGLELQAGLNIITGETGAGKSIILNALGLIAGERGSTDVIRSQQEEASVEALFDSLPEEVEARLGAAGFEADGELVIKRIVSRSGRNRVYLNGSLAPLALLAEIGGALVHIYGQHEHHNLLQPETHLHLLDAFAELGALAKSMKENYAALAQTWRELNEARAALDERRREKGLLEAQAEEIAQARLQAGEEEELRAAKNILAHGEKLYQGCREGEELLYEGEAALVGRLSKYAVRLRELAAIDPQLGATVELLDSSLAQLQEAAAALRRYAERVHFDPGALEQVEDRLAEIQRLKRKYNASVEEILRRHAEITDSLEALEQGDERLAALEKDFAAARQSAWETAEKISLGRQRAAKKLKREMEKEVKSLGMPETVFEARFLVQEEKADEPPFFIAGKKLTERGMDQVEFYF